MSKYFCQKSTFSCTNIYILCIKLSFFRSFQSVYQWFHAGFRIVLTALLLPYNILIDVLVRRIFNANSVLAQCLSGACSMLERCLTDACPVLVRCIYDACPVLIQRLIASMHTLPRRFLHSIYGNTPTYPTGHAPREP